jgi:hypothetical protein
MDVRMGVIRRVDIVAMAMVAGRHGIELDPAVPELPKGGVGIRRDLAFRRVVLAAGLTPPIPAGPRPGPHATTGRRRSA